MFALKSGDSVLTVSPELGGSIMSFRVEGVDVLRPTPPGAFHPIQAANFPLVPWVNRIAGGRFFFDDSLITVPPPVEGEPHARHGHGWLAAWTVEDIDDSQASIQYQHIPAAWPWEYQARQRFTLEHGRLHVDLEVTNLADSTMPAGVGFHPYFERPARLSATVDGMWHTGPDLLPDRWDDVDPFRAVDVDGLSMDNTFTGWDRRAVVEGPAGRLLLSSDLPLLHVYAPRGSHFFCLEPVNGAPDAFNHADRGMAVLAPGESLTATMRIALS